MFIFLYGQDSFRQHERLVELRSEFIRKVGQDDSAIVDLEADKLKLDKLSEAASAVSMFTRKRLIIIRGLFLKKEEKEFIALADYLQKQATSDHVFVLTHLSQEKEKLPKYKQVFFAWCAEQTYSQAFTQLSQAELINWVKKRAEQQQAEFSNEAIVALLSLTTKDLWQLDREIDKLVHLASGLANGQPGKFKIEAALVRSVVAGVFEEHIFALTDAIGERNRARAAKLLEEELLAGQAPEQILFMIERQYRLLLSVRDGLEQGLSEKELGRSLGLADFIFKKTVNQARHYNVAMLKAIFANLIKLEQQFKTGQIDLVSGLSLFVAKV